LKVDWSTEAYCLIGDPVSHSLSPTMLNVAFEQAGLNCVYMAFKVSRENLEMAVKGLKALGFKGFNVTIPHKVEILKFLDDLDEASKMIEAVNVVKRENESLKGYNTDGLGALKALEEAGVKVKGKGVLVLGAGGASRAICFTLARETSRLVIANRTLDKAVKLAKDIKFKLGVEAKPISLKYEELKREVKDVDIIINATSVGMHPNVDECPIDPNLIEEGKTVFDIVYKPLKTRLLREAEARGAKTVDGLSMLVYVAAGSFEIWTGLKPPVEAMFRAALEKIGEEGFG